VRRLKSEPYSPNVGPARRSQYHSHHGRSHSYHPYERAPTSSNPSGASGLVQDDSSDLHGHVQHPSGSKINHIRSASESTALEEQQWSRHNRSASRHALLPASITAINNSASSSPIMENSRTSVNVPSNVTPSSLGLGVVYASPPQPPIVPRPQTRSMGHDATHDSGESETSTMQIRQFSPSSSLPQEHDRRSSFESLTHYQAHQYVQGQYQPQSYASDAALVESPLTHRPGTGMTSASQSSAQPVILPTIAPVPFTGRREKRKDPKPHKCTLCGKGFPRPSALNTHMSVHSGEKREFSLCISLKRC
jgi:Zinc finger, C2H2 type